MIQESGLDENNNIENAQKHGHALKYIVLDKKIVKDWELDCFTLGVYLRLILIWQRGGNWQDLLYNKDCNMENVKKAINTLIDLGYVVGKGDNEIVIL